MPTPKELNVDMANKRADLLLLGKQYAAAYKAYRLAGNENGMENTVLQLLEEAKLQTSRNNIVCGNFNAKEELTYWLSIKEKDHAFVDDICVKYLAGKDNAQLLCWLACHANNNVLKSAAAESLLAEFIAGNNTKSLLEQFPNGTFRSYTTKIELFLEFCKGGKAPKDTASIKHLMLSRKIPRHLLYDYAKLLNDKNLVLYALKRLNWSFRHRNSYNYCTSLAEFGYKEELNAFVRWIEKRTSRLCDHLFAYMRAKDYLQEEYDTDAITRLCIKKIKKFGHYFGFQQLLKKCSSKCKLEAAKAYESIGDVLNAIEIYVELNDAGMDPLILGICLGTDKKSEERKVRLPCYLSARAMKRLPPALFGMVLKLTLKKDPAYCIRWIDQGLQMNKPDLFALSQALLAEGHVYESVFQAAGLEVTAATYREAMLNIKCDGEKARCFIEKIEELEKK